MKICNKCNIKKPLDQFNKNKNKTDGYHVWCKQCVSNTNKKLYADDSERIKQQTNNYYHSNKNIITPKLKEYRSKPEIKNRQQQYIKEWVEENKNYYRQYQNDYAKNRRKNDNKFRIIENLKSQINHYLKNQTKNNKTEAILGYTYNDFLNKIGTLTDNQEIDHKIPVSWFIKETPACIIWDLDNLQLTTKEYNRTKKNVFSDSININYYEKAHKWIIKSRLSKISTYL
jgi:hypothetical protein